METKNVQICKQTSKEIMNYDKFADSVKLKDIKNITNRIASNSENQNDGNIDNCTDYGTKDKLFELAEAENTINYMEHVVKNSKHIIDQNPAKPKDYDEWTDEERYEHIMENTKIYFSSMPDSLKFFIVAAKHRGDCGRSATDRPFWLDMNKFRKGQKFAQKYFSSIVFANFLSLFELFAFADGLKPMIFSQQSHTPYLAFKRYLSTICRVRNWMMEDPWTEGTQAYKDIQDVRRMHRAIRRKLCTRSNEEIDAIAKIPNAWCPDREMILKDFSSCPYPTVANGCVPVLLKLTGLNQGDMAATQFAFMGIILLYPHKLGIFASDEDMAAFCHVWRCIGYLLGIKDEYNFCRGSLKEIKQRAQDFTEVWVKRYLRQVTPEWEHMMRCVMEGLNYYLDIHLFNNMFRESLLFFTDLLNIDMPHTRSMLTYVQRLHIMIQRLIFRYAIRLRFVREYVNGLIHKALDKAIKFDFEIHEKLKKRSAQKVLDIKNSYRLH